MKHNPYRLPIKSWVGLALLLPSMLVACVRGNGSSHVAASIAVPIHGVNYTAATFAFIVNDPKNRENFGGGEAIRGYGGGGSMCCYSLPAKWHPELKVEVVETYWLPIKESRTLSEFKKRHMVKIPEYKMGEAGALWVLRAPEGEIHVLSSNVQPDHRAWLGPIKGWPVPDVNYWRKLRDQGIAEAQSTVGLYVGLIDKMDENPVLRAREAWDSDTLHRPETLKAFNGPQDPAYQAMLRAAYESGLARARSDLARAEVAKP